MDSIRITKLPNGKYKIHFPANDAMQAVDLVLNTFEMGMLIEAIDGIAAEENGETVKQDEKEGN